METEAPRATRNRIYGVLATLAFMLVAFIAGIFVGMHPEWVPDMPWAYHPSVEERPAGIPGLTTQPTGVTSGATLQTPASSTQP